MNAEEHMRLVAMLIDFGLGPGVARWCADLLARVQECERKLQRYEDDGK